MARRFSYLEILSWLVLAAAFVLLSTTILYAQDNSADNGKVRIKISRDIDGKKTRIDTTFEYTSEEAIEKLLEKLDLQPKYKSINSDSNGGGTHAYSWSWNSDSDKVTMELDESIEKSLKEAERSLHDAMKSLKELHIEFSDSLENAFNFNLSLKDYPGVGDNFMKDMPFFCDSTRDHQFKFRYKSAYPLPDTLNEDEYYIFHGESGEKAPVLDKVIEHPDGSKSFIYRRNISETDLNSSEKENLEGVGKLKYYPNPTKGILNLSFRLDHDKAMEISVYKSDGKLIFNDKMKLQAGDFEKKIDLSKEGKGTYYLKLRSEGNSISRKIIVE